MVTNQSGCRRSRLCKSFVTGHDFSRAEEKAEKRWALALAKGAFSHCTLAAAKADQFWGCIYGTTEVVPCYKTFL
jgi:hypothetical protein